MRARPLLVLGLLAAALGAAPAAAEQALDAGVYIEALDRLADGLEAGDAEPARAAAAALLDARVRFGDESLATDASVLRPATSFRTPAEAARAAQAVRSLARRLREREDWTEGGDAASSESLASLQRTEQAEKGGSIAAYPLGPLSLSREMSEALGDGAARAAALWDRFWRWLAKLWPSHRERPAPDAAVTPAAVAAFVAVAGAALALLAYRTLRRSRVGSEVAESTALAGSSRDDDPLSREADEWERFAQELAAAGRTREAIRAWYHAVLSTLFRAGTLHYERGRTNWEYVSRLGPDLAWRRSFIDLTRRFDQEWYGRARASPDALRDCASAARSILRSARGTGAPA